MIWLPLREEQFLAFLCDWYSRYIIPKTWMCRHRCENLLTSNQTFPDLITIIYSLLSVDLKKCLFSHNFIHWRERKVLFYHMVSVEDGILLALTH